MIKDEFGTLTATDIELLDKYAIMLEEPPMEQESPCPKKISTAIHELKDYEPKARRSLPEIFELVQYEKDQKRKQRMSTGGKLRHE